ncbi:hypothetical protein BFL28_08180 [Sphingomonas turrisvirgatae]|uniref:DUF2141 domain-containing protein n=2 Tax=Sphingomonas turrisvirgatae TaxID=1888892 RepID=A0A1E3LQQ0_9SPHN|nr:DUF2141 domain-containing protein [Sphingomonas turrisvirgatae]ODP36099.1 hypothetical protein BFL28_08180 [Sphingomonas turrisvirgatae]
MPLVVLVATPAAAQPVLGKDAEACARGEPSIRVTATGLRDRTGRMKLELFPASAEDFLKDDTLLKREGKLFRRVWARTPREGPVSICIRVPARGRYAILVTHDRDGRNKFNFFQDGAGFPTNRRIGRSWPLLSDGEVNVGGGVTMVTLRMQYLRGVSGFAPLDTLN